MYLINIMPLSHTMLLNWKFLSSYPESNLLNSPHPPPPIFPPYTSYLYDNLVSDSLVLVLPNRYLIRTNLTWSNPFTLIHLALSALQTFLEISFTHSFHFGRDGNFNKDYDRKNTVKVNILSDDSDTVADVVFRFI